jgi:AcrR family transcriptional regulator
MAKHRRLSRELVIARAVALADEAGHYDALTLTDLADAVDVRTPSLYNHIDSLDDLRVGMAVYGVQELIRRVRRAAAGKRGRDALVAIAAAYRDFAHDHPGIYALTIRAPQAGQKELSALATELLEIILLVLASLGLEGEAALHVVRGFRAVLHGFVSLETAGGYEMPLDRDLSFQQLVATYLDGLAARKTPASGAQGEAKL